MYIKERSSYDSYIPESIQEKASNRGLEHQTSKRALNQDIPVDKKPRKSRHRKVKVQADRRYAQKLESLIPSI